MNFKDVRHERTGWRDTKLIKLHEANKIHMYDFLVNEYDNGKSVAIINYVRKGTYSGPDWTIIRYCLMRKNKEPYFTVEYDYEFSEDRPIMKGFVVHPENYYAKELYDTKEMSELDFIQFLYEIRNRSCTKEEANILLKNGSKPFSKEYYTDSDVISFKHRQYGWDVPCVDIDCLLSKGSNPYLFIEYKQERSDFTIGTRLSDIGISDLGQCRKEIPVLLVRYNLNGPGTFIIDDAFNETGKTIVASWKNTPMESEDYFKYILDPSNFKNS